jgi:hypothetical protein
MGVKQAIEEYRFAILRLSPEEGLEELVGEEARRLEMPRLEQKIVAVSTEDHIARLFKACENEVTLRIFDPTKPQKHGV